MRATGLAPVDLPPGWRLDHRTVVDSTNDEAARLAAAGAGHGTVVWADAQQSGRGRRGRAWASPPGNLYCSTLVRPDLPVAVAGQATFAAALAVAEAIEGWLPAGSVALKWPNDVLVGGAKISGILLESAALPGGRLDWLVVGTGINLVWHPAEAGYPTTDLAAHAATAPACAEVLGRYLAALDRWIGLWQRDGFTPLRAAWLGRAHGLGRPIQVRLSRETVDGRFETLDQDGALILVPATAPARRIAAGDVFFGGGRCS